MNIFKSKGSDKDAALSLEDEDAKDFMEYLKEAQETDLREIERTGCVSQGRDMRNGNVIVMIPSLGLNRMERPEQMFRKMLLLFLLKTHEMVGTAYSVVYAHTTIDIINQYPLIYKFYSILPRFYKKNLQKMYIIHPNIGIRAFFEFARIFLSHKFYNKLCLLESILDFQRIIFPTQLPLPLKFLRKEDDEREVKYFGPLPSVRQSYINSLGTMEVLWICAEFLRENKGYQSPGIFRVPGDEGEISLAKVRLQYGYNAEDSQNGWISLSENKKYIVIGNINDLYGESTSSAAASATEAASQIQPTHASGTASGSSSAHASLSLTRKPSRTLSTAQSSTTAANLSTGNVAVEVEENGSPTLSIVILNNTYTVAELFKLSIRELSEPLVPEEITQDLLTLTRVYGSRPLDLVWEKAVAQRLADLPLSNLSTLIFIVRFLRDVGAESAQNNMDTKNLSLVFAPTIFRFAMTDLIAATVDIKLIQSVMREIIERPTLLQYAVRFFRESYTRRRTAGSDEVGNVDDNEEIDFNEMEQLLRVNPFLLSSEMTLTLPELTSTAAAATTSPTISSPAATEELISSGLSPAMVARMNRSATTRRVSSKDDDETPKDTDEEGTSEGAFSRKLDGNDLSGPVDVVEEAFNACTNNRYFAMGRNRGLSNSGTTSGGGGGIMERDMGDHPSSSSSSGSNIGGSSGGSGGGSNDTMRGRAIPPVPPPRQMPPLPASATSHESDVDDVDGGRGAVVLNGQVDREALRLLDDLHLTDDQSKR